MGLNINKIKEKRERIDLLDKNILIIKDIIYEYSGIFISENQYYFLYTKIQKRLEKVEIKSISEYLKYLKKSNNEIKKLLNEITINESYFFREFNQLKVFGEECLIEVAKNKTDKKIKILSAGCSIGAEPYSIAIIAEEMLGNDNFDFEIIAIDIDEEILKFARKGIYDKNRINQIPKLYLEKYFLKYNEKYIINDFIKEKVKFKRINLVNDRELRSLGKNFDFIFCKNVLIYFNSFSRRKVIENFYKMMNENAYIFLGSSESLNRITEAFYIKKIENQIVYQKKRGENYEDINY
ncbi:chemotaxis protein methyltransferase CheR [Hypnocyclicus thermotrophus]|uniref:protein-glutamate O-methyltransferase n=1 Tax=Hypnocyclicus thermotrophus TaxID=1627895 RepID=A0AA46E0R6_9FUSO|nr:protein-glutamate O-methyltransferase CheR [Hypnocyclicus thermotrophus]TDT72510.1 chemotaxis protein methyltransferase CheR [Hypnocyclicus thermotrophus]